MADKKSEAEVLRGKIIQLVADYAKVALEPPSFVPGKSSVPVSGKVLGAPELVNLVEASLDAWLTTGRFNDLFEEKLASWFLGRWTRTTNSGSSANLLAITGLTSHLLGDRRLRAGDEVITVAAGFPTTVNPILQNRMVPVFVDVDLPTCNVDPQALEAAITEKSKAIVLAHTLGNPFNLEAITRLAQQHGLWLVEDCCDALGSQYQGKPVGTFGDVATVSFYPAHHITMGEGGAVVSPHGDLNRAIESLRDWGRDCWCQPGRDNTCRRRYDHLFEGLPEGYDHKYVYSHVGYNLKITDMQAAVGLAQLERLEGFIAQRKFNFAYLRSRLEPLAHFFILPRATVGSDPAWFGFPLTIREGAPFKRKQLLQMLEQKKIGTRLLFGGNLTRQPYMKHQNFRISGSLDNTNTIMNHTFWLGIYPGLDSAALDYVADSLFSFIQSF